MNWFILRTYFALLKKPLLFFILFTIGLFLFNIWFAHEAFAMDPYTAIDFYGNKEYRGHDAYGHFNKPSVISKPGYYANPYDTTHNPDYRLQHKPVGRFSINPVELEGKSLYKHVAKPEHKELHLWTTGQNVTGNAMPVVYELESKPVTFELDAEHYEGSSISTGLDFETWERRQIFAREFVKNYHYTMPKHSLSSSINLGLKTVNDNIVCIYIKCQQIGKRKILWNIWEKRRGKYESYKHFKRSWDSNEGIWSKIDKDVRNDIKAEVEDLLGVKKIKRDIKKSVRSEVEKLLKDKKPFSTKR